MDIIVCFSTGSIRGDTKNEWILGSLSSFGNFTAIHALLNECNSVNKHGKSARLSWGICDERNQMLLRSKGSVPIGIHGLDFGPNEKAVACCTNDGTCFILPVLLLASSSSSSRLQGTSDNTGCLLSRPQHQVTVFPFSSLDFSAYEHMNNEGDEHHTPNFIHGFTAGLCVCGASESDPATTTKQNKQNVYITVSECGFIDVFWIDPLIQRPSTSEADNLIDHLIQNGTIRVLLDALAQSQRTSSQYNDNDMAWTLAANECFPIVEEEKGGAALVLPKSSEERIEEILKDLKASDSSMPLTKSLIFKIASGAYP
jgi:hypothetical protein